MAAPPADASPGPSAYGGAGSGGADELPIDVELIKVLASDSRRDILRHLGDRRRNLTELAAVLGLKKATVLEHLKKLTEAGLIRRLDEDDRLWIYYELTPRGRRLVHPGRTRFYLLMGASAAAVLLLGIVLAVGLSSWSPDPQSSDTGARTPILTAPDGGPLVAYRGLDESLRVRPGPDEGALVLRSAQGSSQQVPLLDGEARLTAETLDALPPAEYRLSHLGEDGTETPLNAGLDVRDPLLSVFPRVVTEGQATTVEITLASADAPAPMAFLARAEGAALPARLVRNTAYVTLGAQEPGELRLQLGRLEERVLLVQPDLRVTTRALDNGQVEILVRDADGPVADVTVTLGGATPGVTDATGAVIAPLPPDGEHALRLVRADGQAVERTLRAGDGALVEAAPRLALNAPGVSMAGSGFRVTAGVRNDMPAEQLVTVTIAAQGAGTFLDSEVVRVPGHGEAHVVLEGPAGNARAAEVRAYAARGAVAGDTPHAYDNATSGSPGAPATTTEGRTSPQDRLPPADARVLVPLAPSPTSSLTSPTAEPAVPFVSPILLIALVVLAALAWRRRR